MIRVTIKDIISEPQKYVGKSLTVSGWVRNHRKQKNVAFVDFYDGTIFNSLQLVYDPQQPKFKDMLLLKVGAAASVTGEAAINERGQVELNVASVKVLGECGDDYPIQPKKHTLEFLRENAYLRMRTRTFQAVFRVRNVAAMAIHEYFQSRGYLYVHTPLITANDAEGAGNTFTVTTYDAINNKEKDFESDFFGKHTALTVSGQLEAETFAMAFSKVYTFGPTFRAENSNTKTHAAEFWMIEPEIAFADLDELMDIEEDFMKSIISTVLDRCDSELEFLEKLNNLPLRERMKKVVSSKIVRLPFYDAIDILKKADKEEHFEFKPDYNSDLAKEHEKYLTEKYFQAPVFVYNWPKDIKAFYMKQNPDGKTVAAVDLLVPNAGEITGGSERETDYEKLITRMCELGISQEPLQWYCNLRRWGSCVHSGFGLGFERFIIYVTGMENIRDVVPYARTPRNCDY